MDIQYITGRICKKLANMGYEIDFKFKTRNCILVNTFRSGNFTLFIAPLDKLPDEEKKIIDSVCHVLSVDEKIIELGKYDYIDFRKTTCNPDSKIVKRCKQFIRLLNSINEGQYFDHIINRSKLRGRACVDFIRLIRVLEELQVLDVTWRKWGASQQHVLILKRKLRKGELIYILCKLLNIAEQII